MKLPRIYLIAILLMALGVGAYGQEPPKAVLIDEFANLFCSDPLRARLDNFFAEISKQPGSVGYIVGNADASMPGRFQKYLRTFQSHLVFRGFYQDRVQYFRGPNEHALHFQFWLVPKGAAPPKMPLELRQEPIDKPVLFDASEISLIRNGTVEFGGDLGGEPCDFGLNLDQFAIALGANDQLQGYLVASSSRQRNRAKTRTALKRTTTELIKEHRIPAGRIKTVFVGERDISEMQLWLVPNRKKIPKFQSRLPD